MRKKQHKPSKINWENDVPDWIEHLKILLPIFAVIAVGAGFYYTTNHRLDHLEEVVESLKEDNQKLRKMINRKEKNK